MFPWWRHLCPTLLWYLCSTESCLGKHPSIVWFLHQVYPFWSNGKLMPSWVSLSYHIWNKYTKWPGVNSLVCLPLQKNKHWAYQVLQHVFKGIKMSPLRAFFRKSRVPPFTFISKRLSQVLPRLLPGWCAVLSKVILKPILKEAVSIVCAHSSVPLDVHL